jgi:hypothetical protein
VIVYWPRKYELKFQPKYPQKTSKSVELSVSEKIMPSLRPKLIWTQDRDEDDECWMAVQANSSGDHISDIPKTKHGWQSCSVVRLP